MLHVSTAVGLFVCLFVSGMEDVGPGIGTGSTFIPRAASECVRTRGRLNTRPRTTEARRVCRCILCAAFTKFFTRAHTHVRLRALVRDYHG